MPSEQITPPGDTTFVELNGPRLVDAKQHAHQARHLQRDLECALRFACNRKVGEQGSSLSPLWLAEVASAHDSATGARAQPLHLWPGPRAIDRCLVKPKGPPQPEFPNFFQGWVPSNRGGPKLEMRAEGGRARCFALAAPRRELTGGAGGGAGGPWAMRDCLHTGRSPTPTAAGEGRSGS